ncbi:MAG TPA: hypothetical protein VKU19_29255 [Bryobacteraceae bacterium]|nr:hypothetical protein [Bryobacteraceae bacterium]
MRTSPLIWSCLLCHVLLGQDGPARFVPPFQSGLHVPGDEDAEIVHLIKSGSVARLQPDSIVLVHGRFLGDGKESVVAAGMREVSDGSAAVTLLFSKEGAHWRLRSRDDSADVAPCRVVPASPAKDVLLCQSEYDAGSAATAGVGEVDIDFYTVDFTLDPADYTFLHLRDTSGTTAKCRSSASVESADLQDGILHVVIRYGRNQLPSGALSTEFSMRRYDLVFRLEKERMVPMERSDSDVEYVTAKWEEKMGKGCTD